VVIGNCGLGGLVVAYW